MTAVTTEDDSRAATPDQDDGPALSPVEVLLGGIDLAPCSSKPSLVEPRGLEPLTPTLPVWCATNCATAPCARAITGTRAIVHTPARGGARGRPLGRVS